MSKILCAHVKTIAGHFCISKAFYHRMSLSPQIIPSVYGQHYNIKIVSVNTFLDMFLTKDDGKNERRKT